jgi:beta-alanine--pyruvate transaminase
VVRLLLTGVDHLPHTLNIGKNAFTKGLPAEDLTLADELEKIVFLHDASNIAAVIVEPIAGSTGVIMPPRAISSGCGDLYQTRHPADLRRGDHRFRPPRSPFAAQEFDVIPDMITCAKGLTNGAIPMGAVLVQNHIYDDMMAAGKGAIELFHGYTYSGHPVAGGGSGDPRDLP